MRPPSSSLVELFTMILRRFACRLLLRVVFCQSLCVFGSVVLAEEPPSGAFIVGLRETARHRPPIAPVRSVKPESFQPNDEVYLWLHVDLQGEVIEARPIGSNEPLSHQVEKASREIHYHPFTKNGQATEAWVQDSIPLLPIEERSHQVVAFPQVPIQDVSIELSRTQCYGSCPAYTVTLYGDGSTVYQGRQFVSMTGEHRSEVSVSAVSALLDRFRSSNFLALRSSYRTGWTDLPTYSLKLKLGDQTKVVEDYGGGWMGMPSVVTELERAVDDASDSARWVTSSPATVAAMQEARIGFRTEQAAKVLRAAVENGDLLTARALLERGTPTHLNSPSEREEPALVELAVGSGNQGDSGPDRVKMLQLLLSFPNARPDRASMQRALSHVVENGDVDLARELIRAGADSSAWLVIGSDLDQRVTYLMLASASGSRAMLEDALARPHNISGVDAEGRTALVWAVWNAPPAEDVFPIIDVLRAHGAARSELDKALLSDCNPNWVPGLVARGANPNARVKNGNTPLFQDCTVEGIRALLDAGTDPTLRNKAGKTAIEATYTPRNGREDSRATLIRHYLEAAHKSTH